MTNNTATDDAISSESIQSVDDIGPVKEEALNKAGYDSLADIRNDDLSTLVEDGPLTEENATQLRRASRNVRNTD